MVLCDVICQADLSWGPEYDELALSSAVSYPMEPHIDCFGVLVFDVIVGKTNSCLVVDLDRSSGLRVTEFFESRLHGAGLFCGEKSCPNLGYHCRAHYVLHYFYMCVNHAVAWREVK